MSKLPDVIKSRPMVSDEIMEALREQDVATVHEAMGRRGAMTHEIKPVDVSMKMCGRALTVQCQSGDNLMLIKAVNMAKPGDVVIANMGTVVDNSPYGEVLAVECETKKLAGVVLTCTMRDTAALSRMKIPSFCAGISVFGTVKASKGFINHTIVVGGQTVRPGDIILGDRDGVVVIPYEEVEETVRAARVRVEKEAKVMERLRNGESLFDVYEYQKVWDTLNITEE